ncbi:HBS1-like protein [Parasteatoda tepidariorum]|uniref:HBS1-like protein n=1 Tax=Parasteatoda tepidariorum TaxID=114398 RepID=UPI001C725627|nr:HBS1-like protein [Parasteatoda tepidariorum]
MARHRHIRALDVDEEYDGFSSCYGHSVEDDFCVSPGTEAQFLYDRSKQNSSMGAFFDHPDAVLEEDDSEEDNAEPHSDKNLKLSDEDYAKLLSVIEAMQNVVGDTIPETTLKQAALDNNFDLEKSLNAVLQDSAPKPMRANRVTSQKASTQSTVKKVGDRNERLSSNEAISSSKSPNINRKKDNVDIMKNKTAKNELPTPPELDTSAKELSERKNKIPSEQSGNASVAKSETSLTNVPDESTSLENSCEEPKPTIKAKSEKSGKEIYETERGDAKPLINLVVIGHVDAGKSTLMGHLLYRLGNISKQNMHKFERDSKKMGKGSFMYAWVLDETPEERNRGITMDVALSSFVTPNKSVTLLDAPGHKDFIPNMITGAAQADVAVLVIDSTKGEFETGFEAGGQTREHTMLIRSLGVTEIAVALNKMDNINWDEERFNDIKSRMSTFLKQVGFKENDVAFVPCSGLTGENLISGPQEPNFKKWYSGPTLVDVIDKFRIPERPVDKPFRMCVSDVFKGATGGFCAAGKIEGGFVKGGDKALVMPAGEQIVIKGVSSDERSLTYGFAGDHVVLQLQGIDPNNISSGSMICSIENPVKVTSRFEARLVIFNISIPITKGFPVILHYQSLSEQAIITKLISQLNRSTGEVVRKRPRCLSKNSSAIVEIEVNRIICLELFKDFKDLGRFMLRSGGSTVAAGLVTEIK